MKKFIIAILFLCHMTLVYSGKWHDYFKVLPEPQKVIENAGKGIQLSDITWINTNNEYTPIFGPFMDQLPRYKKSGISINLLISNDDTPQSEEGYKLVISKSKIDILSKGKAGLFYGCQTLEQIMQDSKDQRVDIPLLTIYDYPKIAYRAVHFDTKHHLDRMEYYYREIDKLAKYKVNAVIWELEDKLRYTRHPEIGAPNSISKQEMQALCRYAHERFIDISPLVQGLGHAGFILKHHWELRETVSSDWEFCPSDPRTYELQFDLYRDALEAMPYGHFLHVGGDEVNAIGIDDRCKKTGLSPFELQMQWLKNVTDFALSQGRTPIFWDDMPLKFGGVWNFVESKETEEQVQARWSSDKLDKGISLFPKDCIYMRWNYSDPNVAGHRKVLQWYRDKGLHVMGATAAAAGDSPLIPRNSSRLSYIHDFCNLVEQNKLCGILATCWDDGSPHMETVNRGFIGLGAFSWNPSTEVNEYKKDYAQREFGFISSEQNMQFLDELEQAVAFYDSALVVSGRRNPAWGVKEYKLIDLPDKNNPGKWSIQYKSRIDKAHSEITRYHKIRTLIEHAKTHALRNRYALELYEQTNELQIFSSKIIVALEIIDMAHKNDTLSIRNLCDEFYLMKSQYEKVYSKTKFIDSPEGYIADRNHSDHLAAKSENSDWMFLYEKPMIKAIEAYYLNDKKL